MIDGRSGGSGRYSYRSASYGRRSVTVAHMPEDNFSVRVIFKHLDETSTPILKIDEREAEMLWVSLSGMAKDLSWSDRMACELDEK